MVIYLSYIHATAQFWSFCIRDWKQFTMFISTTEEEEKRNEIRKENNITNIVSPTLQTM